MKFFYSNFLSLKILISIIFEFQFKKTPFIPWVVFPTEVAIKGK